MAMNHEPIPTRADERTSADSSSRASGIVIAAATAITVIFFAQHPTLHTHELDSIVDELAAMAVKNGIVHGVLIGAMGLFIVGFWGFADRLGMRSIWVRAGLVAYIAGAVAMMAAAATNGFVVSRLASHFRDSNSEALETVNLLFTLCHEANVVCDHIGIVGLSIATLLWSVALLTRQMSGGIAIGAIGLLIGAAAPLLLLAGHLHMNIHGMGAFLLAQAIWQIAVAVQLIRDRI